MCHRRNIFGFCDIVWTYVHFKRTPFILYQRMFTPGDLIVTKDGGFAEVLDTDEDGKLEVSFLKQTQKQAGRIWEFSGDDEWTAIDPADVDKHVRVPADATRPDVVKAWKEVGFLPGGDGIAFCKLEDETHTVLPLYQGDEPESDDEDGGKPSTNPNMHGYESDGFVVPDDEGSDFEFADPDQLDEDAAKWVNDTHQAVHDFNKWAPTDKKSKAVKAYIAHMDHKATIETDNKRFNKGKSSISTSKPPLKKRKV